MVKWLDVNVTGAFKDVLQAPSAAPHVPVVVPGRVARPAPLVVADEPLTMTSLEISLLVDSRHDKVKQSIDRLVERGVISRPPMGEVKVQRERRAEGVAVYHLGKRDSYVVVAQLSPEFTGRLVDRWQELESQAATPPAPVAPALPDFTNPAEAARAWASGAVAPDPQKL